MTSAISPTERASPAAALERRFVNIQRSQMHDMPMLNPALRVEALGFRPWSEHWLGVLVTPWFMNLLLFPRVAEHWPAIGERESRHYAFPAGVFEFIGNRDAVLGDYQACSLFSPMFEFADQTAARDTALAALVALFDAAHRAGPDAPQTRSAAAAVSSRPAMTKRDLLFPGATRASREP